MKINLKAPLLAIGITLAATAFTVYASYQSNLAMIERAKRTEMSTTATVVRNSIALQEVKAASLAALIANLPSQQAAFRKGDHEGMVKALQPLFESQRDQFGIKDAHFALPPATSFLRVFHPETGRGEDMSGFREMVVTTNKTQKAQRGIEISTSGLNVRGVYPLGDDKGHIGSFEVGVGFEPVLQDVKRTTGYDAGIFIDDALMTKVATRVKKPDPERVVGGFRNLVATNWQALRPLLKAERMKESTDVATYMIDVKGTEFGEVVVPVTDFKGKPIGMVVAGRSFEDYQTQASWSWVRVVATAVVQAMLLVGMIMLVINGMLLRPLSAISAKLAKVAKGSPGESLTELTGKQDEVGGMARTLDAIEGLLVERRRATAATKEV